MRIVFWGLLTALTLALPACNTVRGFGQDVQATGNAVEDTARQATPRRY